MGCLSANISRSGKGLSADIAAILQLSANISRSGKGLSAKVGLVCSIPEELAIRFAKDKLVWEGDTNNEGVIMYNTLIATDEWSLEEIFIEELL